MELAVVKTNVMKKHLRSWNQRPFLACLILAAFWLAPSPRPASAITPPPQKLVSERLNYLVALRNFSPAHPLTQDRLMKLVIDLCFWGDFPKQYKQNRGAPDGCEEAISHAALSRFTRQLVGEELVAWHYTDQGSHIKLVGDKIGWWYNTANTMYERPNVHVIGERSLSRQEVVSHFTITHRRGNTSNLPPIMEVGKGTAILKYLDGNWVVTSWQVSRNSHWSYYGSEATTDGTPISSQSFSRGSEVNEQVRFLLRVPPHSTLRQIQTLLPPNTRFGGPKWVQSLSEWGNFINFVGPLKGSAVFLDRTKPYHGMREKYLPTDAINYMVFDLPSSSAQASSALAVYKASITKMVGRSPKVDGTNGNVDSLEWTLIDGRTLTLRSQLETLKLTFPYTIEGEPDDQQ